MGKNAPAAPAQEPPTSENPLDRVDLEDLEPELTDEDEPEKPKSEEPEEGEEEPEEGEEEPDEPDAEEPDAEEPEKPQEPDAAKPAAPARLTEEEIAQIEDIQETTNEYGTPDPDRMERLIQAKATSRERILRDVRDTCLDLPDDVYQRFERDLRNLPATLLELESMRASRYFTKEIYFDLQEAIKSGAVQPKSSRTGRAPVPPVTPPNPAPAAPRRLTTAEKADIQRMCEANPELDPKDLARDYLARKKQT